MIEITDDLLDAAVAAYVDAIDLDVTNKHLMTKVLEAVAPLIAAQALAAERKFLVETLELVATLIDEDMRAKQYRGIEHDRSEGLALALADHIRARGASCA